MSEENVATEEDMSRLRSKPFDALNKRLVDSLTAKTVDEFVVINFASGGNFPWSHYLLLLLFIGCFGWFHFSPMDLARKRKKKKNLTNSTFEVEFR
jgi:hypothetical protein